MIRKPLILAALTVALAAAACATKVGDACKAQSDCDSPLYCERSLPGGYCTVRDCENSGCTKGGVCVVFAPSVSYCMAVCDKASDCRDGYSCVKDFGPHPFCNAEPYARRDDERMLGCATPREN